MKDPIEELKNAILNTLSVKKSEWDETVFKSQQYQQELGYIRDITKDFIDAIRAVAFYSTRAGALYDDFLTIKAIDDILQSAIGIQSMIENGIHNTPKRELRYLIEMMAKYVIVDYAKMGKSLIVKTEYLRSDIPNSSIEIIDRYNPPFSDKLNQEFRNEIKDFFYKACAYVHPSKRQIDEQINNYENGNTIGFESAKMLESINKLTYRAYDMILLLLFHGFGLSMSKDLFEQIFKENPKWKFHKGKYIKEFAKLSD